MSSYLDEIGVINMMTDLDCSEYPVFYIYKEVKSCWNSMSISFFKIIY